MNKGHLFKHLGRSKYTVLTNTGALNNNFLIGSKLHLQPLDSIG